MDEVELLIIGAGSGNSIPTPQLSALSIAIVDDAPWFGGTCLNVGCIPTKMFVHVADVARSARDAERLGLRNVHIDVDWPAIRDRVFGRIDAIAMSGEEYRRSGEPNVSLVRESVRFTAPREVETDSGRRIRAERVVIAAGSRPRAHPAVPPSPRVLTSDEIMHIDALPARLAIVGGGVVAVEFAAMFEGLGVEVVQIARSTLLRDLDPELQGRFMAAAAASWEVRSETNVVASTETADGVRLELSDGSAVSAELVLVAIGREPNTDRLGTEDVGFDHHPDGRLVVDRYQRVLSGGEATAGVFALGDIDAAHQLKHVANHEARVVQANLLAGPDAPEVKLVANDLAPVPSAVFSAPQVAWFGETLATAEQCGFDAFEVLHEYAWTAWGWALEDRDSCCKLVVEALTGRLLGAHIIGPDAPVLLQPLVLAASNGMSVRGLARSQYWPHPAASEIVENALLKAEDYLLGAVT
ncbi:mycothione reductase [Pseudoclavibacter endophyticus]|uniref:Mycothione reductase n=1 Tax=Pseudoclavibacter endophyticus TaxID=1778590 RepID=A0A6H9WNY6_9MICO|nr:mycothione reductase [Pseudoclavibacter endophyticus]